MKRTPDDVSKRKQQLGIQIQSWKNRIELLSKLITISHEEEVDKRKQIMYAQKQIEGLVAAIKELKAQSKAGFKYLDFRRA